MRASHYAHALQSLMRAKPQEQDSILEHFFEVIKKNDHEHLLKKIVRSFARLHERELKQSTIEVVTVSAIHENEVQQILKKTPFSKILTTSHKRVDRKVDDSIVGGVIVRTGSQRVDASYKRALTELYQHITN